MLVVWLTLDAPAWLASSLAMAIIVRVDFLNDRAIRPIPVATKS